MAGKILIICLVSFFIILSLSRAEDKPNSVPCDNVTVVSREEWKSRPHKDRFQMKTPLNTVIIIHTVSPFCDNEVSCVRAVQFIENYHMDDNGWQDIAYNFLIGGDGRVYIGTGWTVAGSHSVNFNTISAGIAFIGNFDATEPPKVMLNAAQSLIACGVKQGYLTPTYELHGHRDVTCTISPGQALYSIIRKWDHFKGGRIDGYNC